MIMFSDNCTQWSNTIMEAILKYQVKLAITCEIIP